MALLEEGRLLPDTWLRLADDVALPEEGAVIVSLARLLGGIPARRDALGVALPNDADPARLVPHLGRIALVVLHFPKHRDGRAFTQARALRERYGFTGALRATGHVLPDLFLFLLRCGVTSIEVPDDTDFTVWARARDVIPTAYQAAVVGDAPLGLLRRRIAVG